MHAYASENMKAGKAMEMEIPSCLSHETGDN